MRNVTSKKIQVTAFPDFKSYEKIAELLAWKTEVWIAEMPNHMSYLNGDKFLGLRNKEQPDFINYSGKITVSDYSEGKTMLIISIVS